MAKLHIRHMVGGSSNIKNEKLFRFEFPERDANSNKELYQMSVKLKALISNYIDDSSENNGQAIIEILKKIHSSDHRLSRMMLS